jgi:hypothetical protein
MPRLAPLPAFLIGAGCGMLNPAQGDVRWSGAVALIVLGVLGTVAVLLHRNARGGRP